MPRAAVYAAQSPPWTEKRQAAAHTCRIASVLLVEAPIAISFSELEQRTGFCCCRAAIGLCGDAGPRGGTHFSAIISLYASIPSRMLLRFSDKIDGPNSSARSVTSEPFPVSEVTLPPHRSRRAFQFSRKFEPSIRGTSTSVRSIRPDSF